jgi:ornithine--oxo-acid transaminase
VPLPHQLSSQPAQHTDPLQPRILATLTHQLSRLTLPSRAFHSAELGLFAEKICTLLNYERVLTMSTGAEATETALKLARRWAYTVKGVPENKAIIYSAEGCFHGRTIASISLSSDAFPREGFGPFVPGMGSWVEVPGEKDGGFRIRFDHIEDLERALELHGGEVAAFILEPIQGEAGEHGGVGGGREVLC